MITHVKRLKVLMWLLDKAAWRLETKAIPRSSAAPTSNFDYEFIASMSYEYRPLGISSICKCDSKHLPNSVQG